MMRNFTQSIINRRIDCLKQLAIKLSVMCRCYSPCFDQENSIFILFVAMHLSGNGMHSGYSGQRHQQSRLVHIGQTFFVLKCLVYQNVRWYNVGWTERGAPVRNFQS